MQINSDTIFSMTEANQNFSRIARAIDQNGKAVVFKNNKPKYIILDAEANGFLLDISDEEKVDIAARHILQRYLPAFKELAK